MNLKNYNDKIKKNILKKLQHSDIINLIEYFINDYFEVEINDQAIKKYKTYLNIN